jgi:phosphoglycolate phosphatase
MLRHFGRSPLSLGEVTTMIGDGTVRLVERALGARPGVPVEHAIAHEHFIASYEANPVALTRPYPGVEEGIRYLAGRGIRLAVCTNKPERASRTILEAVGLDGFFERVIGGDTTPWRKPDRRVADFLLAELGVAAADTLLVGDSEVDAATAAAASLKFVLMSYGYHRSAPAQIPHDALLNSMVELDAARLGLLIRA